MKRRILSIVLVLALCLSLLPTVAAAAEVASGECGEIGYTLTWTLDDAGTLTISGTGRIAPYGYYSPNYAPWHDNKDSIKTLVIENGVTGIGDYAFYECSNLESVTIPEGVTYIQKGAFSECSSLTSVTLPNSMQIIYNNVFSQCSSLTSITIPSGVSTIQFNAFSGCNKLTDINFAEGHATYCSVAGVVFNKAKTELVRYPFGRTGAYTIPDGVTSIAGSAFSSCTGLTSVTIPSSVTTIGGRAFSGCKGLTSITIPGTVESIGFYAFDNCSALTSIVMEEGVTNIGTNAFSYCTGLTSVTIPSSVTTISEYTFQRCEGLTSVTIPQGVANIGKSAFDGCTSLTGITIPSSVTSIGEGAFSGCGLTSITIPGTVQSMGSGVFSGCNKLTEATISEGITSIGANTFYYCSALENVTIPNSVTSIGDNAFQQCSALTSIEIPSSVTSIGGSAFYNCKALTDITIPQGVTSIGGRAFQGCKKLTSITIPDSVTSIGSYAFQECLELASATLPKDIESIAEGTFNSCGKLASITIPSKVTSIGKNAFNLCNSLKTVEFAGGAAQMETITIDATGNDPLLKFDPAVDSDNDEYYDITNANDLYWFAQQVNTGSTTIKAELMNDINLQDGTAYSKGGWTPIGKAGNSYKGTFDGGGHSIQNMKIDTTARGQGLFGLIGGSACIKNVIIDSTCSVKAGGHSAGLAAGIDPNTSGTIQITGCGNHAAVTVTGDYAYAGGIFDTLNIPMSSSVTITNCYNTGAITGTGTGAYVGGIFGTAGAGDYARGNIANCWSSGTVTGTTTDPFGCGASNDSSSQITLTNCYTLGDSEWTGCETKTAEQFASGEVTHALQKGQETQDTQVWGQLLTGDTKDAFPVLTSATEKKVNKVTFSVKDSATEGQYKEHAAAYANPNGTVALPTPPAVDAGYVFYRWSQTEAADGAEFTAETPVANDTTVYAVRQEQYGEQSGEHTVETTYGTAKDFDLSSFVGYAGTPATAATGMFDYTITDGNGTLNATIDGDMLKVPGTVDAGTYTLTINAHEKAPQITLFSASIVEPGTSDFTFTVSVTVEKANSSVTTAPTAIADLTYNTSAQTLVTEGVADGGELQYSLAETEGYSATVPTGTNAGPYTVYYKVVGDRNHNDTEPASVPVTIAKADPSYTAPTDLTATYGQTLADVTLPEAENGAWSWSDSTQSVGAVGSKSFTATFTPNDTTNYNVVNNIAVTVAVGKATPVITALPTADAITYGDALSASGLTGGEAKVGETTVEGSFSWTDNTAQPAVADSETTPYGVTFTPNDQTSYETVTGEVTLVVNKAASTATVNANTLTYTGAAQELVTGTATGGTLQYSLDGTDYSTGVPVGTDATTYTVHYKVVGDENHNDLAAQSVEVTISPKTLAGTVSITGTAAMNETLTAGIDPSEQTVSYQWYRNDDPIADATNSTYTLVSEDVGQTVKVKATGTGNYTGEVTSAATGTVTQARPKITTLPTASAITYGDALSASTLSSGVASVPGTFSWTDGTIKPTVADSGRAQYFVTFTPDDQTAYATISTVIAVTVNPKALTITANSQNITYGGSIATGTDQVTVTGLVNDDTLESVTLTASSNQVAAADKTITPSAAKIKNGDTDVSGNYAISYETGALTIAKSTPTISFKEEYDPSKTYDGAAIPTPTADNLDISGAHFEDVVFTWTQSDAAATPQNAGTYTLTATIPATDNTEAVSVTKEVTISPKTLDSTAITLGEASYTYTGEAIAPAVTVMDGEAVVSTDEYEFSYQNNTDVGSATVTVTDKAGGNYTVSGSATFEITAASIAGAKVAVGGDYTYNGQPQTPTAENVTVTLGGKTLTAGTEYTVETTNNVNAGTATVTVTGMGNYTGTAEGNFTIAPAQLTITAAELAEKTYDGTNTATVTGVTFGGLVNSESLELNTGYTATAAFNSANVNDANTASVTVTLKNGNYALATNTVDVAATISPKTVTAAVTVTPDSYEYTGSAITPTKVEVKDGDTVIPDTEYTVAYSNNIIVGENTATVTVTDKEGGNYTFDAATGNFTITKRSLNDATVTLGESVYTYDGTAKTPEVTVTKGGDTVAAGEYDVSYSNTSGGSDNHTNAGTVTVTVTAKETGDYSGSASATFTIKPKTLTPAISGTTTKTYDGNTTTNSDLAITLEGVETGDANNVTAAATGYTYDSADAGDAKTITATGIALSGAAAGNYTLSGTTATTAGKITKATVTITWGAGATQSVVYSGEEAAITAPTVTAVNNVSVTAATEYSYKQGEVDFKAGLPVNAGTYTVRASLPESQNLTAASADMTLTITAKKVANPAITLSQNSYEYDGGEKKPTVTVKDGQTVIDAGEYEVSYQNNVHVGGATVTVADKTGGNYTVNGTANFQITKPSLTTATVTLSQSEYTYDGTEKTPEVTVMKGDVKVTADEYTVNYVNTNGGDGNHTNAGTVTVTVTAKESGDYEGSKTAAFTIQPKAIAGAVITLGANPTYDGTEKTMTVSDLTVDDLTVTYDVTSGNKGTNAGDYTLKVTGKGNFTGTAEKGWKILPAALSGATFGDIADQNFTNAAITPKPAVALGGKTLGSGTDFTYTYADNKYVGTATVNVTGKGNYTGAATTGATFAITAVADPAVIAGTATVTRGGNTVDLSGNVSGAVGAVSYALKSGEGSVDAQGVYTSPAETGTAVVTVSVAGTDLNGDNVNEYTGKTADITVTVTDKTVAALTVAQTGCTFGETLPEAVYTVSGDVVATTVTYTGTTRSGAAYESADAPTDAGTYTVKVVCETATHIYEGTSEAFTIAPKAITGAEVTLGDALTYNAQSQTQGVAAVTLDNVDILASCDVSGNAATNAGEYTLTVTAKATGNYTGSVRKAFAVSKKAITPAVDGLTALDYTGSQLTQSGVTVKDGEVTLAATDYEIVYGENITAGADAGSLTVKAKGGNYSFSDVTVTFAINKIAYPGATATTGAANYGEAQSVDLTALLAEGYQLGTPSVAADADGVLAGAPTLAGTTLTFAFVDNAEKAGKTATIQVPVTGATNYLPYNVTVTVTVTNKLLQSEFKFAEAAKSVVYGGTLDFPATGAVEGSVVTYASSDPTVATVDEAGKVTARKAGTAVITATASAVGEYAQTSVSYTLEVAKATVTIKAADKSIYVREALPDLTVPVKDADYTVTGLVGQDALAGTVVLKYQLDGKDVTPDSAKAGTYDIVISGASEPEGGNYNAIVLTPGKLTVTARPHSGGSGGSGGGSRTETEKHEDGSVTTTATDQKTGTKTETTKYTDGSQTVVTTSKDGSQSVAATVPAKAVEAAGEKGEAVRVQVPDLTPAKSIEAATPVTVNLSGKTSAKVELPVKDVTPGTVAVIVKADGTEEIARTSVPTEDGVALTVQDDQTVKIIDNSKHFEDVSDNAWYAKNVAFVSSRELFTGTSDKEFSPDIAMSRGMLATVLYRLENEPEADAKELFSDVPDGQYYAQGIAWAADQNIVSGYGDGSFGPDDSITREQLAVMLWRYAGSPAVAGSLDGFTDAGKADAWAAEALRWAVAQGILNGKGGGILDPQGQATRAEVAAMLTRYIQAAQ